MSFYTQIILVLLVDVIVGDPRRIPHPVRGIGWLCLHFERITRRFDAFLPLRWCGVLAFFGVLFSTVVLTGAFLLLLALIHEQAAVAGAVCLLYLSVATGDLIHHADNVSVPLSKGELDAARLAVARLVGRDTANLDCADIARACIESVAENLVDGITAPLFWALTASFLALCVPIPPIIWAAVGALAYKAVNTMDSIYGYRNDVYIDFGRWPARIDDAINYLPARLSGICVVIAAAVLPVNMRQAARIFRKDRLQSPSPNSGHTEAAVAGALGIRLGGRSSYFGEISERPLIGASLRRPAPDDIAACNSLILVSAGLFASTALLVHYFLSSLIS